MTLRSLFGWVLLVLSLRVRVSWHTTPYSRRLLVELFRRQPRF